MAYRIAPCVNRDTWCPFGKYVKVDDGCTTPSALEDFGLQDFLHVALASPLFMIPKRRSQKHNAKWVGLSMQGTTTITKPSSLYMTRGHHSYYGALFWCHSERPLTYTFLEVLRKLSSHMNFGWKFSKSTNLLKCLECYVLMVLICKILVYCFSLHKQ